MLSDGPICLVGLSHSGNRVADVLCDGPNAVEERAVGTVLPDPLVDGPERRAAFLTEQKLKQYVHQSNFGQSRGESHRGEAILRPC